MDESTDRRRLLVSAAAGALLQQVISPTGARAEGTISVPAETVIDPKGAIATPPTISQVDERKKYQGIIGIRPGGFEASDSFAGNNPSARVFYRQHRKERGLIEFANGSSQCLVEGARQ